MTLCYHRLIDDAPYSVILRVPRVESRSSSFITEGCAHRVHGPMREANRKQLILHPTDLEGLLEAEHPARAIWRVLEGLALGRFEESIKAREGSAGRDATDPRILLVLWLYGLSQGVSSARELARLSTLHAAYRWICGGGTVNFPLLREFRSAHRAAPAAVMSPGRARRQPNGR